MSNELTTREKEFIRTLINSTSLEKIWKLGLSINDGENLMKKVGGDPK